MRPPNKFSQRYKKKLENIEHELSNEQKRFFQSMFEYHEEDIIKSLGREKYTRIITRAKSIIDNCSELELKKYKENEIIKFIQPVLFEFLQQYNENVNVLSGFYDIALLMALKDDNKEGDVSLCYMLDEWHHYLSQNDLNRVEEEEQYNSILRFIGLLEKYHLNGKYIDKRVRSMDFTNGDEIAQAYLNEYKVILRQLWKIVKRSDARHIWKARSYIKYNAQRHQVITVEGTSCEIETCEIKMLQNIEELEKIILLELVWNWKQFVEEGQFAENHGKREAVKSFKQIKKGLLCKDKHIKLYKKKVLNKMAGRHLNWMSTSILSVYLEFLCSNIFIEESFWELVYKEDGLKQEYYNAKLNEIMEGKTLSGENELLSEQDKVSLAKIMGNIGQEMEWFLPEDVDSLFELNYKRYSYLRCFYALYQEKLDIGKIYLETQNKKNVFYRNTLIQELGRDIYEMFLSWVSFENVGCFYKSILKEFLYEILEGTTKTKSEWQVLYYSVDEGYYVKDKNRSKVRIWNISDGQNVDDSTSRMELKTHFSYAYQIEKSRNKTKDLKFKVLLDKRLELAKGLDNYEAYMREKQKAILAAWKLYSATFTILRFYKESKEIKEAINELSKSIAAIHNLELRLYILEGMESVFQRIISDRNVGIALVVLQIAKVIKTLAEGFNKLYDEIYNVLLWLYCEEERWKYLLWMRNKECASFTRLMSEVKELKSSEGRREEDTYSQMKFFRLYKEQKVAKGEDYEAFIKILRQMEEADV